MAEDRYYLIPAGKFKRRSLTGVRLDEEHRIVKATELPEPMGVSPKKPLRKMTRLLPSTVPRLVEEGPRGAYVFKLERLPDHVGIMDQDTKPDHKEAATLKTVSDLLKDRSALMEELRIRGKGRECGDNSDIRAVLKRGSWQEIEYGIISLDESRMEPLLEVFAFFLDPPRNINPDLDKAFASLDERTVRSVFNALKAAKTMCDDGRIIDVLFDPLLGRNLAGLGSDSAKERVEASRRLFKHYTTLGEFIEPPKENVVDRLILSLGDADPKVRANIATVLGHLRSHRAVETLGELALKDEEDYVRKYAVDALGMIPDSRVLTPLAAALDDDEPQVRSLAARRLGELAGEESFEEQIPKIEAALIRRRREEEDGELREEIGRIISRIIRSK